MSLALTLVSPTFSELVEDTPWQGTKDFGIPTSTEDMYVRRPFEGMSPKKDTYASLTVPGSALANSSVGGSTRKDYTANFIIQNITEARQEKQQALTTFGDTFYYFFGQQPVQIQISAVLLNSADFEWELEWWDNYDKHLRGTKLVDRNRKVIMRYESVTVTGYIANCSVAKNAMQPLHSMLNFTLFVSTKTFRTDKGRQVNHNLTISNELLEYPGDTTNLSKFSNNLRALEFSESVSFFNSIEGDSWAPKGAIAEKVWDWAGNAGRAVANAYSASFSSTFLGNPGAQTLILSRFGDTSFKMGDLAAILHKQVKKPSSSTLYYTHFIGEYAQRPATSSAKQFSQIKEAFQIAAGVVEEYEEFDFAISQKTAKVLKAQFGVETKFPQFNLQDKTSIRAYLRGRAADRQVQRLENLKIAGLYASNAIVYQSIRAGYLSLVSPNLNSQSIPEDVGTWAETYEQSDVFADRVEA